ncbi:MAG: hypothetical protein ABIK62_07015 [candidate division WOR-3 bacterium]
MGFKAEPGISFGTPCGGNLVARFWYRGFGVSTSGFYLPAGLTSIASGNGLEAAALYRIGRPAQQGLAPYFGIAAGAAEVAIRSRRLFKADYYFGPQVGAYYAGFFAQLGLGIGRFHLTDSGSPLVAFPLFQIGYCYNGTLP